MTALRPAVRAEPNVTPMIDVMLVLLVIFMIVVPAMVNGFRPEPPSAASLALRPEERTDHTLGVDATGQLYLDRQPVARAQVKAALDALYANRAGDRLLYVIADRGLEYRRVTDVMEMARASGVRVVGLVGEAPAAPR